MFCFKSQPTNSSITGFDNEASQAYENYSSFAELICCWIVMWMLAETWCGNLSGSIRELRLNILDIYSQRDMFFVSTTTSKMNV